MGRGVLSIQLDRLFRSDSITSHESAHFPDSLAWLEHLQTNIPSCGASHSLRGVHPQCHPVLQPRRHGAGLTTVDAGLATPRPWVLADLAPPPRGTRPPAPGQRHSGPRPGLRPGTTLALAVALVLGAAASAPRCRATYIHSCQFCWCLPESAAGAAC